MFVIQLRFCNNEGGKGKGKGKVKPRKVHEGPEGE
jgi:hypothetical protein